MTAAALTPSVDYNGNGVTTAFAVPFRFLSAQHLKVELIAATGVVTALTYGGDYSATGGTTDAGGSATLAVAPATGTAVRISRVTPRAQTMNYSTTDTFPAESHELALDRAMLIAQEQEQSLDDISKSTYMLPQGEVAEKLPAKASLANKMWSWSTLGEMVALSFAQVAAAITPHLPTTLKGDKGDRGDPGQFILTIGNFSQIANVVMPEGTTVIQTLEYGPRAGRGGGIYRKWTNARPALPAWAEGRAWIVNIPSNTRWYLDAGPLANTDMFGTLADCVVNPSAFVTGVPMVSAGTNVETILNDCRRWLLDVEWGNGGIVCLSKGEHYCPGEWILSLGETFTRGLSVYGEGSGQAWGIANGRNIPCSRLISDRNDRPLMSVQGARGGECIGIAIVGGLAPTIQRNSYFSIVAPLPTTDDRQQSQVLPATGPHTNGRYNAGCGIAIDPRSGVRPANSYPDAPYNGAAGESTVQYGRAPTSDYLVRGCWIAGFSIGIGIHICDFDGNGDYIRTPENTVEDCLNVLAAGNAQLRQLDTDNLRYAHVHTILNGNEYGRQIGNIAGKHTNWVGGAHIRGVSYSTGFVSALEIDKWYCEGYYRLADIVGNGGGTFSCNHMKMLYGNGFTHDTVSTVRGRAKNHIGVSETSAESVGCAVYLSGSLSCVGPFVVCAGAFETDIAPVQLAWRQGLPCLPYRAAWLDATCGGLACWPKHSTTAQRFDVRAYYDVYDVAATPNASVVNRRHFDGRIAEIPSRAEPAPIWAREYRGVNCQTPVPLPRRVVVSGGGASGHTLTGNILRITYAGYWAAGHARRLNMVAGNPVEHSSGFLGVITGFDTATDQLVIEIDNGWAKNGSTYTWVGGNPLTALSSGTWYRHDGTRYGPSYPLTGDMTSGSTTITNVGVRQGAGAATALATDVGVGDFVLFDEEEEGVVWNYRGYVTAVDATAKTITGTGGYVSSLTQTRRRLTFGSSLAPNVLAP